eukprot:SM000011S19053  [mRNA]  locus=s11:601387:605706:+ [translate_table: standard]
MIRAAAAAGDAQAAQAAMAQLRRLGRPPDGRTLSLYLRALCRGGRLEEAVGELNSGAAWDPWWRSLNTHVFNVALNGCSAARSAPLAARTVAAMDARGVPKNGCSYMELIKLRSASAATAAAAAVVPCRTLGLFARQLQLAGLVGDRAAVLRWWTELRVALPRGDFFAYSAHIIALARLGDLAKARAALQELCAAAASGVMELPAEGSRFQPRSSLPAVQEHSQDPSPLPVCEANIARNCAGQGGGNVGADHATVAVAASSQRPFWSGGPLPAHVGLRARAEIASAYNSVINNAGRMRNSEMAQALFAEMQVAGLPATVYTYNGVLRAVANVHGIAQALRVVGSMKAAGLKPDEHSRVALLQASVSEGRMDDAEALLGSTCHGFNILLQAFAKRGEPARALRVFAAMKAKRVQPDVCTYLALLEALAGPGSVGLLAAGEGWSREEVAARVLAIEKDMEASGVTHTCKSLATVLHVLGKEGMVDAVVQRVRAARQAQARLAVPILDTAVYNAAMHACVQAAQLDMALQLFEDMQQEGYTADVVTYNTLINGCAVSRKLALAFDLADRMRQQGLQHDLITYNALIKVTCHSSELDVALEMLDTMESSGVPPDAATFQTLLSSAMYHKRLDITELVLERMRRTGLPMTSQACAAVTMAYVQANRLHDAVVSLQALGAWSTVATAAMDLGASTSNLDKDAQLVADGCQDNALESLQEAGGSSTGGGVEAAPSVTPEEAAYVNHVEPLASELVMLSGETVSPEDEAAWAAHLRLQYDRWVAFREVMLRRVDQSQRDANICEAPVP